MNEILNDHLRNLTIFLNILVLENFNILTAVSIFMGLYVSHSVNKLLIFGRNYKYIRN